MMRAPPAISSAEKHEGCGSSNNQGRVRGGNCFLHDVVAHTCESIWLLQREPRLVRVVCGTFLIVSGAGGGSSISSSFTLALGWRQGDLGYLQLLVTLPLSIVAFTLANTHLFRLMGSAATLLIALYALLLMSLSFAATPLVGASGVVCGLAMMGVSAVGYPALLAVLTDESPPADLAKAQVRPHVRACQHVKARPWWWPMRVCAIDTCTATAPPARMRMSPCARGMGQGWARDGPGTGQGWARDGPGMGQGWARDGPTPRDMPPLSA